MTSPDTEQFTFEAILLLALLANFHKSDAAKLNPYLRRIQESEDGDFMRMICWSANFAVSAVVKYVQGAAGITGLWLTLTFRAYQAISDDSPPTLAASLGSFFTALRPDRALATKPVDPPRELFKNQ